MIETTSGRVQHFLNSEELSLIIEDDLKSGDEDSADILKRIVKLDLPVPSKVMYSDKYDWPLDITRVNNKTVRNLMSYYTAQVGYANFNLARVYSHIRNVENRIRVKQIRLKALYRRDKTLKQDDIAGKVEKDSKIKELRKTLSRALNLKDHIEALRDSYLGYVQIASREITARENEFRHHIGKPGERK